MATCVQCWQPRASLAQGLSVRLSVHSLYRMVQCTSALPAPMAIKVALQGHAVLPVV